ncbi:very-long-chain 3-oxoacyl-CoA reductase-like [Anneissia japonica]|uniref:very-long-chain 3-oxoacyl-CoA reductase-like n=1 Tax=Anneissia japonica TaxID=1529436 RepID=UPI001425AB38|nr:very-long-chain 3-oxoacyl-CoA reductase-like [Anneissia japonica]
MGTEITSKIFGEYNRIFAAVGAATICYLTFKIVSSVLRGLKAYYVSRTLGLNANLAKLGKWAVVTGATDGIGKAYAEQLAKLGLNIVLISRTLSKLQATASEIGHSGQTIVDMLNCNCLSMAMMTQICLPQMQQRRKGAVINISSASGLTPCPLLTVYSATKERGIPDASDTDTQLLVEADVHQEDTSYIQEDQDVQDEEHSMNQDNDETGSSPSPSPSAVDTSSENRPKDSTKKRGSRLMHSPNRNGIVTIAVCISKDTETSKMLTKSAVLWKRKPIHLILYALLLTRADELAKIRKEMSPHEQQDETYMGYMKTQIQLIPCENWYQFTIDNMRLSVTPFFVSTKLSKMRKASWMVPSPDTYVPSALGTVGVESRTLGCTSHALQHYVSECLPESMMMSFTMNLLKGARARALKKQAKSN